MKKLIFTIMVLFPVLLYSQVIFSDTLIGETGQDTMIYSWSLQRYYIDFEDRYMRWSDVIEIEYRNPEKNWTKIFNTDYSLYGGDSILYNGNYYKGIDIYNYIFENDERILLRNLNKNMILNDPTRYYVK